MLLLTSEILPFLQALNKRSSFVVEGVGVEGVRVEGVGVGLDDKGFALRFGLDGGGELTREEGLVVSVSEIISALKDIV